MNLATVISSEIKKGFRLIKAFTFGENTETANFASPGNIDFKPTKNMKAIFARTKNSSEPVIIGYMNKTIIDDLKDGEGALFSTDGKTPLAIIKVRTNGDLELNGDSDNAVRYSKLEEAYNQLKDDFDSFIDIFNAHTHPGVTSGGSSTAISTTPGQASTGDISGSKVDNVKIN